MALENDPTVQHLRERWILKNIDPTLIWNCIFFFWGGARSENHHFDNQPCMFIYIYYTHYTEGAKDNFLEATNDVWIPSEFEDLFFRALEWAIGILSGREGEP